MSLSPDGFVDRVRQREGRMTPVRRANVYYLGQPRDERYDKPAPVVKVRPLEERILDEVAEKHGFVADDLKGGRSSDEASRAKHHAMYELAKRTSLSFVAISKFMGLKDHTTVSYGVRRHCERNGLERPR